MGTTDMAVLGYEYEHKYYLQGSWRKWEGYQELKPDGEGNYEGKFVMTYKNFEEFYIVRDLDPKQVIYPAVEKCTKAGIPLRGPDNNRNKRTWLVRGPQHAVINVKLSTSDGQLQLSISSTVAGVGERTWESFEGWALQASQTFYLTGSFNDGRTTPMVPEGAGTGVHTCKIELDMWGQASFWILVNEEQDLVMYPDRDGALNGPEKYTGTYGWLIEGEPGASYEVKLDMTVKDVTKRVSWTNADKLALK